MGGFDLQLHHDLIQYSCDPDERLLPGIQILAPVTESLDQYHKNDE